MSTAPVTLVRSSTNPEGSIRRLVWATAHSDGLVSHSVLHTLVQLTAMAHPTGTEGDIVSATFPVGDLHRLEYLGFIKLADDGAIELI